jgi:predicted nucleotidyltransferase component of viral defense system
MITKQEILSVAKALHLEPLTVEKDYVLSWVLYGISQNENLSGWLFKGGTCLKKCYFETYRFSEDLDFTVPKGAIYSEAAIREALNNVAEFIYDATGINLRTQAIEVKESINKRAHITYIAKYTYLGPLNLPSRNQQRIKFDITNDELIVDSHDLRNVFHLYSDAPDSPGKVKCYSVNEILAEKTRAVYERQGRARDVYDIVNISRNFREHVNVKIAVDGLHKKFKFKSLPDPTVDLVLSSFTLEQLSAGWKDQLAHQLELLPPVESFYDDLKPALVWWMDVNAIDVVLKEIPHKLGEITMPRVHFPQSSVFTRRLEIGRSIDGVSKYFDQIRYAARNRLCVEINYHGVSRLIEPYSLRQPATGNKLLYAYELTRGGMVSNEIKSYKIHQIMAAEVKQQVFSPRYAVEL